jgi:uncharacterized protein YpmB
MNIGYIILVLVVLVVIATWLWWKEDKNKRESIVSLKESMDLVSLPVITLYNGKNKFNFIVDTGSDNCFISSKAYKVLKGHDNTKLSHIKESKAEGHCINSGGSKSNINTIVKSTFTYKNQNFKITLLVSEELTESFEIIKKNFGVTIHGLLGTNFLNDYNYILDFAELIAYHK